MILKEKILEKSGGGSEMIDGFLPNAEPMKYRERDPSKIYPMTK